MDDKKEKLLPGTVASHSIQGEKGFAKIKMLLDATGGLSLSQVCAVTGLEGTTVQNWVKRGWVAHPKGKKYEETHIARVLIINALKECIKLEHIALLMTYVNGDSENDSESIINESDLYDYLCDALERFGHVDDMPKGGVESVVERVIKDYKGPTASSFQRIRKALTIMIYACVCTDVKRRTEAMMGQVLRELDDPDGFVAEVSVNESAAPEEEAPEEEAPEVQSDVVRETATGKSSGAEEARRTVAQALREWDMARVESIIDEDDKSHENPADTDSPGEADADSGKQAEGAGAATQKPWYFRRN